MKNWHTIYVLTWANLKSRYRNTFLGFLWVVLNPIITFSVQAYVFSKIFKIQHERYFLFLMSGLIPWLMLVQTLEMCGNFFSNNINFLKSLPIKPLSLLKVQVLDNFINFIFTFFILFSFFIMKGALSWLTLVQMFCAIFPFVIFVYSTSLLLATLGIYFKDLKYITSFIMSIMFYLTPIFYPKHYVPDEFKTFIDLNPFYIILKPFHDAIDINNNFANSFSYSCVVAFLIYVIAKVTWLKSRKEIIIYA